ncbi:LytTR family DNA-binding domain-containing protein [Imperialibacter roseus]|uniref:LytTR family DNA-binding domain-containing protein n=1 Tax=Imperialibacter roseus TaxID=1324217 RepID=A0ABZ0IIX8_9BACT|nr:LytTR family DNA-binding domain-containing protein [Imperialibacter roseus]WOK04265.1 LytTR family DNA-binding domain-containing protein [Imperialibacter roseus]|tara:strand:- start:31200 stop:31886 length:687 start_codon:yes stop_codon:yes gene_type:complete
MKLRCLIVDDEPLSQEVIEGYVNDAPQLELAAKCSNALEAAEMIRSQPIDLIFLDINMPKLSGISLVKSLAKPPAIVFITAYPEFAVEGFEVEAVDYLLKPCSFERFLKAVSKVESYLQASGRKLEADYFVVKADKKLHKIGLEDILYFKSIGDYVKVYTRDKVLITNETLRNIEDGLPPSKFIRLHKSFVVSLQAIQYLEGNQVKVGEEMLPVGLTYKDKLMERLGG